MPTTTRDDQRSLVYEAENELARILARGGMIDFFGSRLAVPDERKFGDVASIGPYLEKVLTYGPVARLPRAGVPVTVRERNGNRRAHYEADTATIAVPPYRRGGTWALRETVVLHELAHHLTPGEGHGPAFTAHLLYLTGVIIGAEAEHMLRVAFYNRDVKIGATP